MRVDCKIRVRPNDNETEGNSEMTERIAEITTGPHSNDIITTRFSQTSLKFKCQRCAVFCCKCGGPNLSSKEVGRLKQSGKHACLSIDSENPSVKNRKDGSCAFLAVDSRQLYRCSIYEERPTLCRIYPFQFIRLGEHSFALNVIPCCNGLNAHDGEPIDSHFFMKHLKKPFLDLVDSNQC